MCNYCRFDEKHQAITDGLDIERYENTYKGFPEFEFKLFIAGSEGYSCGFIDIEYCPKCGRKLDDDNNDDLTEPWG